MLVIQPQFLVFHNEMLTIENAVSSAKFVKQPFSQALGEVLMFFARTSARTQSIFILLEQHIETKDSSSFTN